MLKGVAAGSGTGRRAGAGHVSILSSTDSSVESALPAQLISDGPPRHVGRVAGVNYETSDDSTGSLDDSFSDNSEEYVPLAFGYINSNPKRHAGAPARSSAPAGVSEEVVANESLSLSEAPLEVFLERGTTQRKYGACAKECGCEVISSRSSRHSYENITSPTSSTLTIEYERTKRTRKVGKVKYSKLEVSEHEPSFSVPDAGKDQVPLNAQLIYTLIKRLRNPTEEIPLEAFDFVDLDDDDFKEELIPLRQIKALLQERSIGTITASAVREGEMKETIESLPPEEAFAAKVKAVACRQLRSSHPQEQVYEWSESVEQNFKAIEQLVHCLKDPDIDVPLSAFDGVDLNDEIFARELEPLRQIHAFLEAKEGRKEKPGEEAISSVLLDANIKTAITSLSSERVTALRIRMTKDLSKAMISAKEANISKKADISAPPGMVKRMKDNVMMSGDKVRSETKTSKLSASTSQIRRINPGIIASDDIKLTPKESSVHATAKKRSRRPHGALKRNVSFSHVEFEIPPEEISEDEHPLAGTQISVNHDEKSKSTKKTAMPQDGQQKLPLEEESKGSGRPPRHSKNGVAATQQSGEIQANVGNDPSSKPSKRRHRTRSNLGRSISILSLPDVEAGEVVEEPTLLSGRRSTPPAHNTPHSKEVEQPPKVKVRMRRRKNLHNSIQFDQVEEEVVRELEEKPALQPEAPRLSPAQKKRRPRTGRNRSCSVLDVLPDEVSTMQGGEATALKVVEVASTPKAVQRDSSMQKSGESDEKKRLSQNPPNAERTKISEQKEVRYSTDVPLKMKRIKLDRNHSIDTAIKGTMNAETADPPTDHHPASSSHVAAPGPEETDVTSADKRTFSAKTQRLSVKPGEIPHSSHKRRQRRIVKTDMSISAIPDALIGEIVEQTPTSLAPTTLPSVNPCTERGALDVPDSVKNRPVFSNDPSQGGSLRRRVSSARPQSVQSKGKRFSLPQVVSPSRCLRESSAPC